MKQKTIERFRKMVKPYKKTILIVTLMALFIDICELVKPYLLEQVMDKYLPEKLDTKWLALIFSIIIGGLRIVYVGQFDFAGIVSGIINIFVLLGVSVGLYEVGASVLNKLTGGSDNAKQK